MENKKNFWLGFAMLAIGVVIGFLLAPIKKGISVKVRNSNQPNSDDSEYIDDCGYDEIYDDTENEAIL